jgi:Nif-specific regulatory protein
MADAQLRSVDSIDRSSPGSLICVPMLANSQAVGAIYLQAAAPAAFDSHDVHLVTAFAGIAAAAVGNLEKIQQLRRDNEALSRSLGATNNIVGDSPAILKVYSRIRRLAEAECTVLILGETGTGKEVAARAIHEMSKRADRAFVAINCAVLTETLFESELFGHEKGAFTGAVVRKEGKLEVANHGTLFLDEVGELTLSSQAKLLRVIQEREFERIGGTRPIKIDVRLLAATNKNLHEEVLEGNFRADLYYRLNVISVSMPPLRDRMHDVPLLAEHFLANDPAHTRRISGISPGARDCLLRYHWPGNIRELRNAIQHAVVLGSTDSILRDDLPEHILSSGLVSAPGEGGYHEGLQKAKRDLVSHALAVSGGDYRAAAQLLKIDLTYIYRLVRSLGLVPDDRAEAQPNT